MAAAVAALVLFVASVAAQNVIPANSTNYFYGFLITFLAILLLFVLYGLRSRNRAREQARFGSNLSYWGFAEDDDSVMITKPKLWEIPLARCGNKELEGWSGLMPVNALVAPTRYEENSKADTSTTRPPGIRPQPSRNPSAMNGLSLPSRAFSSPRPSTPTIQLAKSTSPPDQNCLQAAFIISMPSKTPGPPLPQALPGDDVLWLPEYQVGVVRLPWATAP